MKRAYLIAAPVSLESLAFCFSDCEAEVEPDGGGMAVVAFADEAFLVSAEQDMSTLGIKWCPA